MNQDVLLGSIDDGQSLNRYAFVTGKPVSFVDPFGLAQVLVRTVDGKEFIYYNPTAQELVNIINSLPNKSLSYLRITGHGSPTKIDIAQSGKYLIFVYTLNGKSIPVIGGTEEGGYVIDNLDYLLKDKLNVHSRIEFAGCNTAKGDQNITKLLSLLLPGTIVVGGTSYLAGSVEGGWIIPLDEGPNWMTGFKKLYVTFIHKSGRKITEEWIFLSLFD